MSNVRFNLKDSTSKGETLIFLIYRFNGSKLKYSTREKVQPKAWNKNKMEVRSSYIGSVEQNARLRKIENDLNKIYTRLFADGSIVITPKILKEELDKALWKSSSSNQSLLNVLDKYIETSTKTEGTIKKYKSLRKHLEKFDASVYFSVDFNTIEMDFYEKFVKYFYSKGYLDNTVGKYISTLKAFLNWATEKGYNKNLEFRRFKNISKNVDIIYLNEDELNKFCELDLSGKDRLARVRDFFCLSCYTGLRYSDVANLELDSIQGEFIVIDTIKTRDKLKIPILPQARTILDKYLNDDVQKVISNQKMNQYLKEIGELAGFGTLVKQVSYSGSKRIERVDPKYKLITTHTARRTFITLALEKGMRHEVIMKITGHKDYSTFKKYVKLVDSVIKNEMLDKWT